MCSVIRCLLPISVVLFIIPCFVDSGLFVYIMPICYFFGTYFVCLNFPYISECLHSRPLYIDDLRQTQLIDQTGVNFVFLYNILMSFILAVLFTSFVDYFIMNSIKNKPFVEVVAIIGGNFSLYIKIQQITGKILIRICHCIKESKGKKHRKSTVTNTLG